jgi:hypothetical protein
MDWKTGSVPSLVHAARGFPRDGAYVNKTQLRRLGQHAAGKTEELGAAPRRISPPQVLAVAHPLEARQQLVPQCIRRGSVRLAQRPRQGISRPTGPRPARGGIGELRMSGHPDSLTCRITTPVSLPQSLPLAGPPLLAVALRSHMALGIHEAQAKMRSLTAPRPSTAPTWSTLTDIARVAGAPSKWTSWLDTPVGTRSIARPPAPWPAAPPSPPAAGPPARPLRQGCASRAPRTEALRCERLDCRTHIYPERTP